MTFYRNYYTGQFFTNYMCSRCRGYGKVMLSRNAGVIQCNLCHGTGSDQTIPMSEFYDRR